MPIIPKKRLNPVRYLCTIFISIQLNRPSAQRVDKNPVRGWEPITAQSSTVRISSSCSA